MPIWELWGPFMLLEGLNLDRHSVRFVDRHSLGSRRATPKLGGFTSESSGCLGFWRFLGGLARGSIQPRAFEQRDFTSFQRWDVTPCPKCQARSVKLALLWPWPHYPLHLI